MEKNSSLWKSLVTEHPLCTTWKQEAEGAIYHLASILFVFVHIAYQVHSITFARDFHVLYSSLFKPLGIPLPVFRTIALSSEVVSLEKEHCYAMQGKTSIDRLSVLISGRIRVTVDGEFLHYISPFQFLDSPEWDSLRPTEEGVFQVTLTADTDCRYVSWRRKKLYLLFAQHRYISRLFSVLIGSDIADKLYALNDRVYIGKKHHYDIRLPNYYQMSTPDLSRSPLTEQFRNSRQHCNK